MPAKATTDSLKGLLDSATVEHAPVSEDDAKVDGLSVTLLPHQIEGLRFLLRQEAKEVKNKGGLLCDDMGLGKTIQSISLILSRPQDVAEHTSANACKATLVVAPLSLIAQWKAEINQKAAGLRVLVHHGSSRTKDENKFKAYDVVVTTYQVLSSEYQSSGPLFKLDWWRVILDEAHTIKNKTAKASVAAFNVHSVSRWALTGTPLQNNIDELHSLFLFLQIPPLCDSAFWKTKISGPIAIGRGKIAMKRLQVVLSQVFLRRTKAVLGETGISLPKRNIHRTSVQLTPEERAFYTDLEKKVSEKMEVFMDGGAGKYMSVLLLLLRLRQACDHTGIVAAKLGGRASLPSTPKKAPKGRKSTEVDDLADVFEALAVDATNCYICQTELARDRAQLGDSLCEACDARFKDKGTTPSAPSSKIKHILRLLQAEPGRKTIIFSQFTTMLDMIEPFMVGAGLKYARYDGSMKPLHRNKSLEALKTDPDVAVLLCSLKCGALGLNLVCASRVVLVDPWWNPMVSEQAIDRVHRIGQTRDVDVYEITVENSVEERIVTLQDKKRELAKSVLDERGGTLAGNKLSRDEILFLFNRDDM
ncbi:SNF2 family N-terminal domain-containing protein [Dipodascopsis tothii]|uniref:SNF2 family N-terminal domain-containing protein n=1 Tax=Dipodascopsis tothii TaxID=44089 RepID=UPI0034CFA350